MTEKIIKINEIDICTESFGNSANPTVLLIMGAMCSMVYWDEEFCQQLADTVDMLFVMIIEMSDGQPLMNRGVPTILW